MKSIVGELLSAISFELKVSMVDMLPNCLLQFSFESKLFWCCNELKQLGNKTKNENSHIEGKEILKI